MHVGPHVFALQHGFQESGGSGRQKTVAVLGAGVAGLVAAYELERLGHRVDVYEASHRVGGRIHTHRFGSGPDAPLAELGAMRVPREHRHTMHYIRELGLSGQVREFRTLLSDDHAYVDTWGGPVRVAEASPVLVRALRERLPESEHRPETLVFGAWLIATVVAIAPQRMRDRLLSDPVAVGGLLDLLDAVDLRPYLDQRGRQVDLAAFFADHPAFRYTLPVELADFIDDILTETSEDLVRLEGGMDAVTSRLATRLRHPVRMRHTVAGLSARHSDVVIELAHRGRRLIRRYDYALCTIPFSALRRLDLRGFDDDKLAVVHGTTYCSATKVAFHCREPFWEHEGITGGGSSTGGATRQTYYPDGGPVLLASYAIGEDADLLGAMPVQQRHEHVRRQVSEFHPRLAEPGMVQAAVSMAWGHHEWTQGGCTVRWGKDGASADEERSLASKAQNHLFFAGEHCSANPAWIDGAIESALDAVSGIDEHRPSPILVGRTA